MADQKILTDEMRLFFNTNYIAGDIESLKKVIIDLTKMGYGPIRCVFLLIDQLNISFQEANAKVSNAIYAGK